MDTAEENVNQRVALPGMDELFNWNSAFVFYEIIFHSTFLWNIQKFENNYVHSFYCILRNGEMSPNPSTPALE